MLYALIWKELRMFRATIVSAVAVTAFIYVVVTPVLLILTNRNDLHYSSFVSVLNISMLATGASTLFAAVCGGVNAPTERRERWADFVAMLPVSRRRVVSIRLGVGAALVTVVWLVNISVITVNELRWHAYLRTLISPWRHDRPEGVWMSEQDAIARALDWHNGMTLSFATTTGLALIALFGIAWLFGSYVRSPAVAVAAGIIPFLIGYSVVVQWIRNVMMTSSRTEIITTYTAIAAAVGLIAMVVGTVIALRRVEP